MRPRPIQRFLPGLERFEPKCLLNAGAGASLPRYAGHRQPHPINFDLFPTPLATRGRLDPDRLASLLGRGNRPRFPIPAPNSAEGLTLYRITDPTNNIATLTPPFHQTLVQSVRPIPGEEYNILSVSVLNNTARTFDASSGLSVRVTGQSQSYPILTGNERWRSNEVFVFYILTKEYYPLRPIVGAGFEFNLAGTQGVAIPGPSGVFLRINYNPATFPNTLDQIIARGPGAKGHELGLPDTSIWEIVSARTDIVPL